MSEFVLQIMFYAVICVSALMYIILDGFDLGVGILHMFARNDKERRIFLNAIGPVWDGNEVWLVVILGGLFAGFPLAYATILSSFYTLMMILIGCLTFRASAIEFRSKHKSKVWRTTWDLTFSLSSLIIAFILGVGLGNLILGISMDTDYVYTGSFADFFTLYTVLVGCAAVFLLAMHGAIYLVMKTEGEEQEYLKKLIIPTIAIFFIIYALTTVMTILDVPHMVERMMDAPWLFLFPILALIMIVSVPILIRRNRPGTAFITSCLSITFLMVLYGIGTFPHLVRSVDPANNITIFNASSSAKTLGILMTIVCIGIPLVLAYGFWVYRIFRGKVVLNEHSY